MPSQRLHRAFERKIKWFGIPIWLVLGLVALFAEELIRGWAGTLASMAFFAMLTPLLEGIANYPGWFALLFFVLFFGGVFLWDYYAEGRSGSTDNFLEQPAIGGHGGNSLDAVLRTDIEEVPVRPRERSSGLVPDMSMREAVVLAANSPPESLGNDLDRLNDSLTQIRQLAHQGEIQVWGKRITDRSSFAYLNTWSEIPRDFWETKEISPLVLDGAESGAHTIIEEAAVHLGDRHPDYCATRVNREQFERVIGKTDPESLGVILRRYLDEGWDLFNRVGKRSPDFRIVNLDGQAQHDIMEWSRKVEQILEESGMHKAKRDFCYYKLETTGELRVRASRLKQIVTNEMEQA